MIPIFVFRCLATACTISLLAAAAGGEDATHDVQPRIIFQNVSDAPLTLFWIAPDGTERQKATIQPGKEARQRTQIGQRFRVRGSHGFTKLFVVRKNLQTFQLKPTMNAKNVVGKSAISSERPNIVFCMADDWSWPHASILGDQAIRTPHFDRVASEGALFKNAFVSTPSCTPSRLSILTGQHHWRLKEGDSLGGSLRLEFDVYTELLQESGYCVGRFGKGVWPSKHTFRKRDAFGEKFASFDEFLDSRAPSQPICYWHGGQDPHRPYELGIGEQSGIDLSKVRVPACLPDNQTVRSDIADYLWEVQRFDREVGKMLKRLESIGELNDTIFVVSGDNGMPFPRCKATLYDQGTRVPLAIRWGRRVTSQRVIDDLVSLCDLAPTFLAAAGIDPPKQMTGRSLLGILQSKKSGQVEPSRKYILAGVEKHVYSYPKRALRTKDFLYIRNFAPGNWKTGEIEGGKTEYDFSKTAWPKLPGAFSFAIDPSPTKQFLRLNRADPDVALFAKLAFATPPPEELYDLSKDPEQISNVANEPAYVDKLKQLREQLEISLTNTGDPRMLIK